LLTSQKELAAYNSTSVEGVVCEKWRRFKEETTKVVIKTAKIF
jgi:hypothetical protein